MSNNHSENAKIEGMENAAKAGLWYTISAILLRGISLFTTPIFTRVLSTADYGIASTFVSWSSIFTIFCTLNLGYSIGRAKQDFPGKLDKYIGAMEALALCITGFLGIFAAVFIKPVSNWLTMEPLLVYMLVLYLLTHLIITFTQSGLRYQYRYKGNILISFYSGIIPVALSLTFIGLFPEQKYFGKILGIVVASGILALILLVGQIKAKNICINKEYWKYGLKISLPLIVHTLSLNILSQSDRLIINAYCGAEAVAIYSLAYVYAMMINLVLDSINQAWNPWFHDNYFIGNYDEIRKNVKPLVILGCMLGIGCIGIAPEAIHFLGGAKYAASCWVVPAVAVGVVCQYVYSHYVIIEMHLKKTIYVSVGTVVAAAINVALNYIFVPRVGYIAAAYTTLASYIVLFFLHFVVTRWILKIKLYHDSFMFGSILVVGVVAAVMMGLYEHVLLRYILLSILCVTWLILNKNFILSFLNKRKRR